MAMLYCFVLFGDALYLLLVTSFLCQALIFAAFASCTTNFGSTDLIWIYRFILSILKGFPEIMPMALRTTSWFRSEKYLFLCVLWMTMGVMIIL